MKKMTDENPPVEVRFSKQFLRDIKKLAKKYRHIKDDLISLTERLEAGEVLGDQLQGLNFRVYKVRVRNSDIEKGKSGGYRVVYYFRLEKLIYLLAIYSKSDYEDLSLRELHQTIETVEEEDLEDSD